MPSAPEVFAQLLEVDAGEREGLIDALCEGDEILRAEVRSLLIAFEGAGGFLETCTGDPRATLLAQRSPGDPGSRVGPYRLMEPLGEGGMGVVFRAERDDGQFRQSVALKLIRHLSPAEGPRRRFLAERQILARLDHPHIAHLLDGGIDAWGRPYLVMELVDGRPLMEACRARGMELAERLRLFVKICGAVAYAHRQLVVHRDLKPANILLTPDGSPKLLDFGVAKALDAQLIEGGTLTGAGPVPFTPEYAAPEQVRGEPCTVATDVYGLGLILFELVTGARPFDLSRASLAELAQVICHQDTVPPSTLWARPSAGPAPREAAWAPRLRGDLDAIVARALRKAPADRYPSAEALAADVERHLRREPVEARAGDGRYRLGRFLSRNRLAVGASAAVALSMTVGLGVALWQAHQAVQAAERATRVQAILVDLFGDADPDASAGEVLTAEVFLDRGSAKAAKALADQPRVRGELSLVLGGLYSRLGRYELAADHYASALVDLEGEGELAQVAEAALGLCRAQVELSRYDEAATTVARATELVHRAYGPRSMEAAEAASLRGILENSLGNGAVAEVYLDDAVTLIRSLPDVPPLRLAQVLQGHAAFLVRAGRFDPAEAEYGEVLSLLSSALGADHSRLAEAYSRMGTLLVMRGEPARARPYLEEALRRQRRILGPYHPSTLETRFTWVGMLNGLADYEAAAAEMEDLLPTARQAMDPLQMDIILGELTLSAIYYNMRRYEDALAMARLGREHLAAKVGPDHLYLAMSCWQIAGMLMELGRLDEVGGELARAEAILTRSVSKDHIFRAEYLVYRGRFDLARGLVDDAERALAEGVSILQRQGGAPGALEVEKQWLARVWLAKGRAAEGKALLEDVLPGLISAYGEGTKDVDDAREGLRLATVALAEPPPPRGR